MATRIDRDAAEIGTLQPSAQEKPCTLGEMAMTVVGLLGMILVPAVIGLLALKLMSIIFGALGYSSIFSF